MVASSGTRVRAAVVGTGLIGGSILLRLHRAGLDVTGWDPDPATRLAARDAGVPAPDELTAAVAGRYVVFLCGPLPTLPETLLTVAAATGGECVLTDVGSTKGGLAAFAAAHGLTHRFVPGHPMAGTDRAGLGAAEPDLLTGAAWVLCPSAGPGLPAFRWLTGLLGEVFQARVVPMAADRHDAVAALASHVPHLLAGALAGAVDRSALRDAVLALAAGSFRDGTRVAGTPPERTANMLLGNREHVLRELAGVRSFLDELAGALADADAGALTAGYRDARATRTALTGRAFTEIHRSFPADTGSDHGDGGDHGTGGDHGDGGRDGGGPGADGGREELDFLLGIGAAGGHLSRCRISGTAVEYTAHKPAGEMERG
ncbi:prephenate dehydrogenase [Micromonospora cathayae]|uniref:Prephenate dehydrogenase/arogenate dehydrogenase family protein n=1 Tax=Micromonospora cathayae TaxID=3028804 RepID=A0ABY7ZQ89_9ACTN|nr:prephenate dehydrogenase/arogenate dehydrogenase family protein [Micromonospora sp. HUAS 3]WDZ85175.1 prephenate dehydrogenase/arogenate dehydrogenase family protein [Micromonospora sp. HUAS 3]